MTADELDRLYQAHHGWLHTFVQRRMRDAFLSIEACDLVQETFLRLLLKPRHFASCADARAFLCTVAKGLYVDHWRRRQLELAWAEAMAALPAEHAPCSEHQASVLQALCRVDGMLRRLPENVRTAFLLSQVYGRTYLEIAARLGVSERMVKKYMAQAMLQCLLLEAELHPVPVP